MKKPTKKNREKELSVITAILLLLIFIYTTIAKPGIEKYRLNNEKLQDLKLEKIKVQKNLALKDKIENQYQLIEPLISSPDTENQQISKYLQQLDRLYKKANVNTTAVRILPVTDMQNYIKLALRIELSAKIENILRFISMVETLPDPVSIENFIFKTTETQDNIAAEFLITKIAEKN